MDALLDHAVIDVNVYSSLAIAAELTEQLLRLVSDLPRRRIPISLLLHFIEVCETFMDENIRNDYCPERRREYCGCMPKYFLGG